MVMFHFLIELSMNLQMFPFKLDPTLVPIAAFNEHTQSHFDEKISTLRKYSAQTSRGKNVDLTLFNIFAFDLTDIHVTKLSHQFERRAKVQNLYTKCTHSF